MTQHVVIERSSGAAFQMRPKSLRNRKHEKAQFWEVPNDVKLQCADRPQKYKVCCEQDESSDRIKAKLVNTMVNTMTIRKKKSYNHVTATPAKRRPVCRSLCSGAAGRHMPLQKIAATVF